MIKRLRFKFIGASMLALVLLAILGGINWMSYRKVVSDADFILSVLAANQGDFPQRAAPAEDAARRGPQPGGDMLAPRHAFSDETPYESRFFSVLLDEAGQVLATDTGKIAAVGAVDAAEYARQVLKTGRKSGFWGVYRYLCSAEASGDRVIFLDCSRGLSDFYTVLAASVLLSLLGLLAVWLLLLIFSGGSSSLWRKATKSSAALLPTRAMRSKPR